MMGSDDDYGYDEDSMKSVDWRWCSSQQPEATGDQLSDRS